MTDASNEPRVRSTGLLGLAKYSPKQWLIKKIKQFILLTVEKDLLEMGRVYKAVKSSQLRRDRD